MNIFRRALRHARLSWRYLEIPHTPLPSFLTFFINSVCNLSCSHCFYWKDLNKRNDLTFDEITSFADEIGKLENLNLSGGEPFLRKEIAEICRYFIQNNGVQNIYIPTNGSFPEKTVHAVKQMLKERRLEHLVIELSLDGMPEFHNAFRGSDTSFERAMETYRVLAELQNSDKRVRIHAISTATHNNLDEIKKLTTYLFDQCPQLEHHNIALIRGDWRDSSLELPDLNRYRELLDYVNRLWFQRDKIRFGAIVEPMLQWAKIRTAEKHQQIIPCRAGVLSCVIYANGDVSFCENNEPVGNLREQGFREIWYSNRSKALRHLIRAKTCTCTNEIFLWPSFVYQPLQLFKTMIGAKIWHFPVPLPPSEKVHYTN